MGKTLLLTGWPGIGKTTVIKKVADMLGEQAGGFYTEELRGPGGRKGFRLVTLSGQAAVMAHVTLKGEGRPRVGRYGVDVRNLDKVGVAALRQAMEAGKILLIDEIGKMELFSGQFKDVVVQAITNPQPVVATMMRKPNPWVDALKILPDVEVWEVTAENRDDLPQQIMDWLEEL
jgi:nucleoside-triphosphatase